MPFLDSFEQRYDWLSFSVERSAVQLISLLLADRELQRAYRTGYLNLQHYAEEHKHTELLRLTVEIATSYRLVHWNNAKSGSITEDVGILMPDESKEEWIDLSMLEACNKIIHAEALVFERQKVRGAHQYYLKPALAVSGKKGKKQWSAVIEMLDFCNAAVAPQPLQQP